MGIGLPDNSQHIVQGKPSKPKPKPKPKASKLPKGSRVKKLPTTLEEILTERRRDNSPERRQALLDEATVPVPQFGPDVSNDAIHAFIRGQEDRKAALFSPTDELTPRNFGPEVRNPVIERILQERRAQKEQVERLDKTPVERLMLRKQKEKFEAPTPMSFFKSLLR